MKDTQSTLNDVQVQNEIFLNQLTEKKAELQIRENAMRVVELELQAALSKQEQIEEICSSYEENFARVYGGLQELYGMVLEKGKKFDTALSTIQALGGRVDFANNRLKFIAGE